MKKVHINIIALAISLGFSAGAIAENLTKEQYKSLEQGIATEYKAAKARCDSFSGNAKDICVAEAKGKEKVGKAELEHKYRPTIKTRYDMHVANAEADYAVALEKCDDKAGNAKDVCLKEAKAAKIHAIADADAQMKTSKAGAVADEKSESASATANATGVEAHKDAEAAKRDADYKVAKEKCDALAGDTKERCIADAKARLGGN